MAFNVRILADSITELGCRLTSYECTYWRGIHAEVLTHGMLARNSASSRAIPTEKLIQRVLDDPFIPVYIGKNQKGMQAGEELDAAAVAQTRVEWLLARDHAVARARALADLKVHKQLANRLIEPWMWITVIISATEWDNFFGLRDHPAAEPHFQQLAREMKAARLRSEPKLLKPGEWHLPLFGENCGQPDDDAIIEAQWAQEREIWVDDVGMLKAAVSAGRCARVSYLTHDGVRDVSADIQLYAKLMGGDPKHASPAEHAAQAMGWPKWYVDAWGNDPAIGTEFQFPYLYETFARLRENKSLQAQNEDRYRALSTLVHELQSGKFRGFKQLRKFLKNENIGGPAR